MVASVVKHNSGPTGVSTSAGDVPDWVATNMLDLRACRVLQDVSAQIVDGTRSFGTQLQVLCGQAVERLPTSSTGRDDEKRGLALDYTDDCVAFLTAYASLSHALLSLAGDLESIVLQPLQQTIATVTEESQGRMKHWRQLRGRFAELQEQYRRSRQRSNDAKSKLNGATSASRGLAKLLVAPVSGKTATDQHAAMCDLASCEEQLLRSEVSLRELEAESRERLQELGLEKASSLREALARGAGSLRRLLLVAEKIPATSMDWQGVLPPSDSVAIATPSQLLAPMSSLNNFFGPDFDSSRNDAEVSSSGVSAADPFSKYLKGDSAGDFVVLDDINGDSINADSGDEVRDVAARASDWTPSRSSTSPQKRRSLVFQKSSALMIPPSFRPCRPLEDGSPMTGKSACASPALALTGLPSLYADGASSSAVVVASPAISPMKAISFGRSIPSTSCRDQVGSDDEEEEIVPRAVRIFTLQEAERTPIEFSPLIAECPRDFFQRYINRFDELLKGAAERCWDKLQRQAEDAPLGGHVGKLEFFWIHRLEDEPSAETAEGLVCFQFVQGFSCNFARILHLSTGANVAALPCAIFGARRLIFGTMPVDSIRATILACEDDNGHMLVDGEVERAYNRSGFRWFQLTQKIRRSKSKVALGLKHNVKSAQHFLVLNASRNEADPLAPKSSISIRPALLLKSELSSPQASGPHVTEASLCSEDKTFKDFSAF